VRPVLSSLPLGQHRYRARTGNTCPGHAYGKRDHNRPRRTQARDEEAEEDQLEPSRPQSLRGSDTPGRDGYGGGSDRQTQDLQQDPGLERSKGDPKMARRLEVVIDSSVAVKWFSEEEATPQALELRDSHVKGHVALITTPLLALAQLWSC